MRCAAALALSFFLIISIDSALAAGAATSLTIAAGDGQIATAGTKVRGVVCVIARDAAGVGVPGVIVTWDVTTGAGTLTDPVQPTGSDGIATLGSWVLGPAPGSNSITASSPGLNSVTFGATGIPGATHIEIAAGDHQTATVSSPVPGPVCTLALDAMNNPVSGFTINWAVASGGGTVTGQAQKTGPDGIATLGSWTLGSVPGANTLICGNINVNVLTFTASAVGSPGTLSIAAGNKEVADVGTPIPGPICALVRDSEGVPAKGITVTFGNVTGGGSISGATQVTDATGIVTLGGWIVGPVPGPNSITASADGLPTITFIATAQAKNLDDNVVLRWDNLLLQQVLNSNMPPPICSRAMAVVHTAIFDAWAAYDPKAVGTQLGGTLRRPVAEATVENKKKAISYAAYRTLLDLFPAQKIAFDTLMSEFAYAPDDMSVDPATAAGIGNLAAAAILAFRHKDGSNQLGDLNPGAYSDYTSYEPVNDPDSLSHPSRWQPLRAANGTVQTFLTPHWGLVTPFAIGSQTSRKNLMPKACATYPGKAYKKQADDLVAISANLTDTQKAIASYWADGAGTVTPPGHWHQFGQFVSRRDKHTLDDDAKMFFALSNAVFDAGIEVWDCKRHYDSVRPVSAIRFLDSGKSIMAWGGPNKGTQSMLGDLWQSYIPTPAFSEYVSGHSTFSAASCAVLTMFTRHPDFGNTVTILANSSPIESSVPALDVTLSWKKFSDAADEAAMSRRYGGIHFQDGDLKGRKLGLKIGTLVFKKAQQYIDGKASGK